MSVNVSCYLRALSGLLLLCIPVGARPSLRANAQDFKSGESRAYDASSRLEVESKARYFLGETPTVRVALTNASGSPQTVKEAEYQVFSLEMIESLKDASGPQKKTGVYDGRWEIPKGPTAPTPPGGTQEWLAPKKREPKLVTLAPGASTALELNLAKVFGSFLGVGKYRLSVNSEDGQKAVKEFEVYFDDAKSVPALAQMLASGDEAERNWAVINLAQFNRPRLVTLLQQLAKSGDKNQRDFADEVLAKLEAGRFDLVKLRVENKDRYFLGEAPVVAVSALNGSSAVQTMKAAEYQKFSFELVKAPGTGPKQESKTCVYDGEAAAKQPAGRARRKPQFVKLSELDSTSVSVNLFECFRSHLDVGKYELTVQSADEEQALKGQKAVGRFEVYFDDARSTPVLARVLKSDGAAERQWAVSVLAQYNRQKLTTLLEELVKSGDEQQRDFAGRVLAEIKAGRYGSGTSPQTRRPEL